MNSRDAVFSRGGKLWGCSGGELEFVSLRTEVRQDGAQGYTRVVVLRFTDHDVRAAPMEDLVDGEYYEFEFVLS